MLTGLGGRTGLRSAHVAYGTHGKFARRPRRLAWALALAVALAAMFLLSLRQSLTTALSSDGAANILQAQAMLHGNPLLRGWWTSDVSFYTTELPEYALVVAARGMSPDVVHICGALTYTLTVALAGLLARGRATGPAGLGRAGIAVAIMLAPSVLGGTEVFLENPDHFGTSVPVLLVLLLLDWGEGRDDVTAPRWYVPVAVGALLAWTEVGDELSLVAATVPIAAVCGFRLAVTVAGRRPRIGLRWDGLLLAGALVSVPLAELAERALRAADGFGQPPIAGTRLASLGQFPANAGALWQSLVLLFGANNPGQPSRAITISNHVPLVLSADLHVIGLAAAGAGLVAGIAAGFFGWPGPAIRPGPPTRTSPGQAGPAGHQARSGQLGASRADWADRDRVDQILVVAIGVTITAGLVTTVMKSLTNAHEVAILLPLGAVLAGRTLPSSARPLIERIVAARVAATAHRDHGGHRRAGRVAGGRCGRRRLRGDVAGLPGAGAERRRLARRPPPARRPGRVLAGHGHDGRQRRPGAGGAGHRLGRRRRPLGGVVRLVPAEPVPGDVRHRRTPSGRRARLAHGRARPGPLRPAAAEYHVGGDIVMVYRYNLLSRLHGRTFAGPS